MVKSRFFRCPILAVLFFLLEAPSNHARSHLPFLPTDEGIHVNNVVSRHLGLLENQPPRRRRNLVSTLSLLWPQVVGPIDNGVIKEEDVDTVPMTALEHQLIGIRERSKMETETRQHVRDLLNFGSPMARLTLQQMHALHNDMNVFWNRHNRLHPGHFHAAHHIDPAAFIMHHTIMDKHPKQQQPSVIITGQFPGHIEILAKTAENATTTTKTS